MAARVDEVKALKAQFFAGAGCSLIAVKVWAGTVCEQERGQRVTAFRLILPNLKRLFNRTAAFLVLALGRGENHTAELNRLALS